MKQYEWITHLAEETQEVASALAKHAFPGMVIALDGDLGAGKTTFSKGFAESIGIQDVVNSPTFTIIKEYEGELPLYHMDVYRLTVMEADELGLEEYFYEDGVTIVEWAEKIRPMLSAERLEIYIRTIDESKRELAITPWGEPYKQLVLNWWREKGR